MPENSRVGRHKQRYNENGERLVAGCIPIRFLDGLEDAQQAQVCMITTTSGKGLVFPKGGWEDDESMECAAKRETVEEAGVRGTLEAELLGVFAFQGGKPQSSSSSSRCRAYMYIMYVAEELSTWPESKDRQRVWVNLRDASRQCKHAWMRDALHTWVRRRGWDVPPLDDSDASTVTTLEACSSFARSSAGEASASSAYPAGAAAAAAVQAQVPLDATLRP